MQPELAHRSRDRGRRWLVPVASASASLAAHLLLLAALARVDVPPPVPRPGLVTIELVEAPAATPPPAAAPTQQRLAGGSEREAPASQRRAPPSPRDASRTSSARLADEGIPAASPDRLRPDLRPRPSIVARPSDAVEAEEGDQGATLRSWAAELAGRARVESGLAHPYHSGMARALSRSWDVERTVKARGLSGYLADAGDAVKTYGRVWAAMAEGFGRTGAPSLVDGGSDRFRELSGLPPGPARAALAQAEVLRQLHHAWSEGHVASVRVVQGRDGRLKSVKLLAPSSDAALDREALAAVPAAVASVPTPPEVLAGREELATVWEFEVEVSITPPVPMVAVEFDEVLGVRDVRVPLDRRVWKRVRLVAIE